MLPYSLPPHYGFVPLTMRKLGGGVKRASGKENLHMYAVKDVELLPTLPGSPPQPLLHTVTRTVVGSANCN